MTIAVDFDGTIVEHKYPAIGKERPFAIDALIKLAEQGHRLILWTSRDGKLLDDAVKFCHDRGLDFYAVNSEVPANYMFQERHPVRKIRADLYIDDRNYPGLPDWGVIYEDLSEGHNGSELLKSGRKKKKSGWHLFGK